MNHRIKSVVFGLIFVATCSQALAQSDWTPTGVWPFLNQKFRVATIVAGFVHPSKTQVPCNIHIGNQSLYYSKDDTLMIADRSSIIRVEFPDEVYIPMGQNAFGKIVHEDSIGKVIRVREVDAKEMEKRKMDASNLGFVTISSEGVFPDLAIDFMGQYEPKPEERPLPILDTYYFYFKGELFESTTKNILNHINPVRRKEYKAYTRTAEILSRTESSNMKIWNDFFVHY